MQIPNVIFVTSLYVVGILGSTNINSYGNNNNDHGRELSQTQSHGDSRAKVNKALRDHHDFFGFRNRHADAGHKYAGSAGTFGHKQANQGAHGNSAAQNFAKQDSKFDEIARQIAAASKVRGYQSASKGQYNKVDDDRHKGYDSAAKKGSKYNRGKVFNDNIVYGFKKDFAENLSERGGFEEEQGHKKHKLDEYKDKQKIHKLKKGDHTAANAREDNQKALKESKYNKNAAQKQADKSKYGNNEKKLDKAGATQDAQSLIFDRKDSKSTAEEKGKQVAANQAKQFANKDNLFGRNAAASHAGAQDHKDNKYYGGHGDQDQGGDGVHGGPGPHLKGSGAGGHVKGSGGLAKHSYGDQAKQSDHGKEHLSQAAGAVDQAIKKYDQAKNKQDFKQLKSLKNQREGKFAQGVHNAEKNGYNDKNSQAAKSAHGDDRKYADATAQSKALASKHDRDEELSEKENAKKQLHDDNETFKKVKNFYHDKKTGGKNIETLKYNRKRIENEFGNFQQAQNEKQNQFDKNHKSAKHHAAARSDNFQDAKKASQGFGHHNAGKSQFGTANKKAAAFKQAASFNFGKKKQIHESDFGNHKDELKKKQQQLSDVTADSSAEKGNGYRNADGFARESKGGPLGGSRVGGLRHGQEQRGYGDVDVQPIAVHDVPHAAPVNIAPHQVQSGGYSNNNNNNNRGNFGTVKGDNFGRFSGGKVQRRIGADVHGQSGYNNNNNNNAHGGSQSGYSNNNAHGGSQSGYSNNNGNRQQVGGLFNSNPHGVSSGGFAKSKFGSGGLFGNFGSSFGSRGGSGSSKFGNTYASHSGTRNSVGRSGGLFNKPIGSFGRSGSLFSSPFGSGRSRFGSKSRGILF